MKKTLLLKILVGVVVLFVVSISVFVVMKMINKNNTATDTAVVKTKLEEESEPTKKNITKLFNVGDYHGALNLIDKYLEANPSDADVLATKATVLANIGSVEFKEKQNAQEAIKYANKALEINPKQDNALYARGYAYEIQNKFDEALMDYKKVLEQAPTNPVYITQMGHLYDLMGDTEKAKTYYEKALEVDNNYAKAMINLGRYYQRKNDATQAIKYYEQSLINSNNVADKAGVYYSLGIIEINQNKLKEARKHMEDAVDIMPKYPQALIGRGWAGMLLLSQKGVDRNKLAERGINFQLVFDDVTKAIDINPNQTIGYLILARMYLRIPGQASQSIKYYDKALEVVDNDITIMSNDKDKIKQNIIKEKSKNSKIIDSSNKFNKNKQVSYKGADLIQKILLKSRLVTEVYAADCFVGPGAETDICFDQDSFDDWVQYLNDNGHTTTVDGDGDYATCTNGSPVVLVVCGSADGQEFFSKPTTNLCDSPLTTYVKWEDKNANDGTWNWVCGVEGDDGNIHYNNNNKCSASKKPVVNGECKYKEPPLVTETKPDQDDATLCLSGTATTITGNGTKTHPWRWNCIGDGPNHTNDSGCLAHKPIVNGKCLNSNSIQISADKISWAAAEVSSFCTSGDPSPNPPAFPSYGATRTWNCNGKNGGTNATGCSAKRGVPKTECGSANKLGSDYTTNTKPANDLCKFTPGSGKNNAVTLNDSGVWHWTCTHDVPVAYPKTASCQAPSCLANPNLIKANTPVMLTRDNDQKTTVGVDCPGLGPNNNVCCDIHKTPEDNSPTIHVCTGDSDKEIQVESGVNTYPAKCYFDSNGDDDGSGGGNGNGNGVTVNKSVTISTMCTNRACNSQGTCQATPKIASSLNQCSSSCSSNADCTRGRIIETRP